MIGRLTAWSLNTADGEHSTASRYPVEMTATARRPLAKPPGIMSMQVR